MLCIKKIKRYTRGQSKQKFLENELLQDAVMRNIEIIGEASKNISLNFKQSYSSIPWKEMSGMRDKLIHHYMGVDLEMIWNTVKEDVPFLEKKLKEIV